MIKLVDLLKEIKQQRQAWKNMRQSYKDYKLYIAEIINKSVDYTEYLAKEIDKSITYTEYLSEKIK